MNQQGVRIGLQIRRQLQRNENIFRVGNGERDFIVIAVRKFWQQRNGCNGVENIFKVGGESMTLLK